MTGRGHRCRHHALQHLKRIAQFLRGWIELLGVESPLTDEDQMARRGIDWPWTSDRSSSGCSSAEFTHINSLSGKKKVLAIGQKIRRRVIQRIGWRRWSRRSSFFWYPKDRPLCPH